MEVIVNASLEIVVKPYIEQIQYIILHESQTLRPNTMFLIEELLESCYCMKFHVEKGNLGDNFIAIFTPINDLQTENARETLALLDEIRKRMHRLLPKKQVEVYLEFMHETAQDRIRYGAKKLLQKCAEEVYAAEEEMKNILNDTTTPIEAYQWNQLTEHVFYAKNKAHEFKVLLAALKD